MGQSDGKSSVAERLVGHLKAQGVERIYCVPGESYLPVLDALYGAGVDVVVCRQEGGMAMMAEAHGKLTGRPGVAFVTRGPGATNAAAGVHVAYQDSTPMVLFVGQVKRGVRGRDAWQEVDYVRTFAGLAKWAVELDDPARLGEIVHRAFHTALSGRPGPVVVALPEDVLRAPADDEALPLIEPVETAPRPEDVERLDGLLRAARNPLLVLGGGRWSAAARQDVRRFAEAFDLPVVTSHRRGGVMDWRSEVYAGELGLGPNPAVLQRAMTADLLIVLGGRLGDVPSQGYAVQTVPAGPRAFVHIYPDAEELGRVYRPTLAIHASPGPAARALAALVPPAAPVWAAERSAARAAYLAWSETATPQPGGVNLGEVVVHLREVLGETGTLCNGAGNFAAWVNRYWRAADPGRHVAPTSGSMGYGLPAAIAVKRAEPQRLVAALCGDGDFLMTGQEFATAVQHQIPVIAIVADNRSYGTIRMHQERDFPGRVVATDLVNPDFAALARAFGGFGVRVERTEDFKEAFAAARASGLPAILHLIIDTDAISPSVSLSKVREAAMARQEVKG